jgi:hypothetical protein
VNSDEFGDESRDARWTAPASTAETHETLVVESQCEVSSLAEIAGRIVSRDGAAKSA